MTAFALRAVSLVLTLLYTLFALTTCQLQEVDPSPASANREDVALGQSGPVVLNILHPRSEIAKEFQEAADLFLTSTGRDARINIQMVEGSGAYRTALRARLLSGEGADLFQIYGARDLMELEGYLRDLSHLDWIGEALPGTLEEVNREELVYGVPYAIEGVGLIANRNIFEAANIPLADIDTFEDLEEAFADLREQILAGDLEERFPHLQAVTELPALDTGFLGEQLAGIALTGVFSSPQQAANSAVVGFHQGAEDYLRLLARHTASRSNWEGLNSVALNRQLETGLASGRVALIQQSTETWNRIIRADPELDGRLALLPIPLDEEEEDAVYTGVPAYWSVGKAASPQAAELAEDFLTWLYRSETGTAFLASRCGVLSPYRDTARTTGNPLHEQLLRYIDLGQTRPLLHSGFPEGWGAQVFAPAVREYLAGELDWAELNETCAEGWKTR